MTAPGIDEAVDRAERAEAALSRMRYKAKQVLARNNELVREVEQLRDKLSRVDPTARLDLDAMRGRLSDAADGLSRVRGAGLASAVDIGRIDRAIQVITDTVRILYHTGGDR